MTTKLCTKCGVDKPEIAFGMLHEKVNSRCRACERAKNVKAVRKKLSTEPHRVSHGLTPANGFYND